MSSPFILFFKFDFHFVCLYSYVIKEGLISTQIIKIFNNIAVLNKSHCRKLNKCVLFNNEALPTL